MSGACSAVGGPDRRWAEAARDAGVTEDCKSPHGKTAEQTKKAQRPTVAGGLVKTGPKVAAEAAAFAAKGSLAAATGMVSVVAAAGAHVGTLYHALADAAELKDAYQRDAVNLAFVWTASNALPPDYVQRVGYELRAVGGERGGANKILTPLMRNDREWQAIKSQTEGHVKSARAIAKNAGLTSRAALAAHLKRDPQFAAAYSKSLAVKHGVDSYVFEQEQRRIAQGK